MWLTLLGASLALPLPHRLFAHARERGETRHGEPKHGAPLPHTPR
jgi:hypothetical protein